MKTMYIECGMGAAGDMLTAALLELVPDTAAYTDKLNRLGMPGVVYDVSRVSKCGIEGTQMTVKVHGLEESFHDHDCGHDHEHDHACSGMSDIREIVEGLNTDDGIKEKILEVYSIIADAESAVHGVPVSDIHFHEVGTLDAVADVAAVCMLIADIAPDRIIVSPVHVGSGTVRCAHGEIPVPAPATARILTGCPVYGGEIKGELCTPTGAALLRCFADSFGPMPPMKLDAIGYGMGHKDFENANCVRIMIGKDIPYDDNVIEFQCNIDDMTGEELGYATDRLMETSILDVCVTPVLMKKNRPGFVLTVLCRPEDADDALRAIFKYTTTLGVRALSRGRYTLDRRIDEIETALGTVRVKTSSGYGTTVCKYEYEDLASIARDRDMTLREVREELGKEPERAPDK